MAVHRPLAAVVLAAGEGTRMRSTTPKVLHPLAGRPMLAPLVDTLVSLPIERVVVVVGQSLHATADGLLHAREVVGAALGAHGERAVLRLRGRAALHHLHLDAEDS